MDFSTKKPLTTPTDIRFLKIGAGTLSIGQLVSGLAYLRKVSGRFGIRQDDWLS